MRQIELTMTHPEGAFLTEDLFVPRFIWHQDARIYEIEKKLEILRSLKKQFLVVRILYEKANQMRVSLKLLYYFLGARSTFALCFAISGLNRS